jgi:hypothetical protein
MAQPHLLLYSRQGCCLCEGLAERLHALPGGVELEVIDVDRDPGLQQRYGLEVPVLVLRHADGALQELPRVSPRLGGDGLAVWLQRNGFPGQAA